MQTQNTCFPQHTGFVPFNGFPFFPQQFGGWNGSFPFGGVPFNGGNGFAPNTGIPFNGTGPVNGTTPFNNTVPFGTSGFPYQNFFNGFAGGNTPVNTPISGFGQIPWANFGGWNTWPGGTWFNTGWNTPFGFNPFLFGMPGFTQGTQTGEGVQNTGFQGAPVGFTAPVNTCGAQGQAA